MAFDYITTAIATLEGIRKAEKLIMMPETTCSLSHITTCDLGSVIVVQSKTFPRHVLVDSAAAALHHYFITAWIDLCDN